MKILQADYADLATVKRITHETIQAVYPRYYPCGAVAFFQKHHCDEAISYDIAAGVVYLCVDTAKQAVGTVTIKGNALSRLFVLPQQQGNGYGGALLAFAEREIAKRFDTIVLDASLPAKAIYLKRGYVATAYHCLKTDNGDFLCYDVMEKSI